MEDYSMLQNLIEAIEYRSNLHISVLFLSEQFGSIKNMLDLTHSIHSKPFCDYMKAQRGGLKRCMGCKNLAVEKAVREKIPYSGLCINGIYEYCRPVIHNGETAAVIFIGNIITDRDSFFMKMEKYGRQQAEELSLTLEPCEKEGDYAGIAEVIDSYIRLMAEKAPFRTGEERLHPAVKLLRDYIAENFDTCSTLSEVAKLYHFNEKYLGRMFKKQTGLSFGEYRNRQRLNRAAQLLAEGTEPVTRIAEQAGYNSTAYFSNRFRQYFGLTPSEYRNGNQCRFALQNTSRDSSHEQ